MSGFRSPTRKEQRTIGAKAAAIGAGAVVLGSLALGATAAGAAQVSNPPVSPIKPCVVQNYCWSTHSRTFTHQKAHDLWAVASFPSNQQWKVNFDLTCTDGTHQTGSTIAYPDVPNYFGATGANNGIIIAAAQPGNKASTTCTLKETLTGSWTITSEVGTLTGTTDYVRFDNV